MVYLSLDGLGYYSDQALSPVCSGSGTDVNECHPCAFPLRYRWYNGEDAPTKDDNVLPPLL